MSKANTTLHIEAARAALGAAIHEVNAASMELSKLGGDPMAKRMAEHLLGFATEDLLTVSNRLALAVQTVKT